MSTCLQGRLFRGLLPVGVLVAATSVGASPGAANAKTAKATPMVSKAAFVDAGSLFAFDWTRRTVTRIETGPLIPVEADISPGGRLLAMTATTPGQPLPQLYLGEADWSRPVRVETGTNAHHRSPKFSRCGDYLDFAVTHKGQGGPDDPTQIRRLTLSRRSLTAVTDDEECHFAPTAIAPKQIASAVNRCTNDTELVSITTGSKSRVRFDAMTGPSAETATSPGCERLLYTKRTPNGMGFYVRDIAAGKRTIAAVRVTDRDRVQPTFVSRGDVVFLSDYRIWRLDVDAGSIEEIAHLYPNKSTTQGVP